MDRSIQSALTQASITIEGGKNNRLTNVLIKESVKDHVFPVAKFLHLVDLPYPHKEKTPNSWLFKMVQWCNIPTDLIQIWWDWHEKWYFKS